MGLAVKRLSPPPVATAPEVIGGRPAPLPPADVLHTPLLGHYEIEARLGATPEAELLRVVQIRENASPVRCLMKRLVPGDAEETVLLGRQLYAEGLVNMGLSHPGIVRVYDYGSHQGRVSLVRELVDGASLHAIRGKIDIRRLPTPSLLFLAFQLADALAHAHEHQDPDGRHTRLVHGRLSPSEILVTREGQVKLTEMSVLTADARLLRLPAREQAWRRGYMAPEQLQRKFVEPRSDLFSLGLVLVELLSGRPIALDGAVRLVDLASVVRERCKSRRDLPPEIAALLEELTALDAERRSTSAREVARIFASVSTRFGSRGELGTELARFLSRPLDAEAGPDPLSAHGLLGAFLDGTHQLASAPPPKPEPPRAVELAPLALNLQEDLSRASAAPWPKGPLYVEPRPSVAGRAPSLPAEIPTSPGAGRAAAARLIRAANERTPPNLDQPAGLPTERRSELTTGVLVLGESQIEQLRTRTFAMMEREARRRRRRVLATLMGMVLLAAGLAARAQGLW